MDIKKGDRVKVTIEGVVSYVGETWLTINHNHDVAYKEPGAMVEKIEPPVEVFKPGDVVRNKFSPGGAYALGLTSYTHVGGLNPGASFDYSSGIRLEYFNSTQFERVDLG